MKKIITILVLASMLCTATACNGNSGDNQSKNESSEGTSIAVVEDSSSAESNTTPSLRTVYSYDENNSVTKIEYDSEDRVVSIKRENFLGDIVVWRQYGYTDGFSVTERTAEGKVDSVRVYDEEAVLRNIDVYTDNGLARWTNVSENIAEKTQYNLNGNKIQVYGYEGSANKYKRLEGENHIYTVVFREDGSMQLRNEFEDGVQKKSISYKMDGSIQSAKEFFYNEAGKNIRVDELDANGNVVKQILYGYNENGSYSFTETKTNGITTDKKEYIYDESGVQTGELVYKFDAEGNPTEYEKWTVSNGNKTLEGVYPVDAK